MNREPESGIGVWFGVSRNFPDACHNCHSFSGFCKTLHHCHLGYSQRECEHDIIRWPETPPVLFLVHFLRELLLNFPVAVRQAREKMGEISQTLALRSSLWQVTPDNGNRRNSSDHFIATSRLQCHFFVTSYRSVWTRCQIWSTL